MPQGRRERARRKRDLMNKSGLIDKVSDTMDLARRDGEAAVNAVIREVMRKVKASHKAAITGFGAFNLSRGTARRGRNQRTRGSVKKAAPNGIRSTAGTRSTKEVNGRSPAPTPAKVTTKKADTKTTVKKTATKTAMVRRTVANKPTAKRAPGAKTAANHGPRRPAARKTTTGRAPTRKAPARPSRTR